tara:strand:- start:3869 stop:4111 length:243 start_codon:yes stop_codon:yes gene_type:complete
MDKGSRMLIPTSKLIQDYIYHCEKGSFWEVQTMRNDLAIKSGADFTCPMTSGIFLRTVCEYITKNGSSIQELRTFVLFGV